MRRPVAMAARTASSFGSTADRRLGIHGWTMLVSPEKELFTGGLADGGGA
jgi:hypothetical protein